MIDLSVEFTIRILPLLVSDTEYDSSRNEIPTATDTETRREGLWKRIKKFWGFQSEPTKERQERRMNELKRHEQRREQRLKQQLGKQLKTEILKSRKKIIEQEKIIHQLKLENDALKHVPRDVFKTEMAEMRFCFSYQYLMRIHRNVGL